jgi:anti-sigma regulatory factor (Ser/Thr protein kinase)
LDDEASIDPDVVRPLVERVSATPAVLSGLRRTLTDWLRRAAVPTEPADNLVLAVNEAAANAVEHAYPPDRPGTLEVAVELTDGIVRARVTDAGRWQRPDGVDAIRGRGLLIMRECVDELSIDRTARGTSVVLCVRLRGGAPDVDHRYDGAYHLVVRAHRGWTWTAVRGAVPARSADPLRRSLLTAARGGSVQLVVDLTAVTEPAEGAAAALAAVADAALAAGNQLVVRAIAGSPAWHAVRPLTDLQLVGL